MSQLSNIIKRNYATSTIIIQSNTTMVVHSKHCPINSVYDGPATQVENTLTSK